MTATQSNKAPVKAGLLDRLKSGPVICAEGFVTPTVADLSFAGKMADGDIASPSASAMSNICWPSAGWTSPMKRSDDGC
jgi:hypothetical protein